jgi:hypothetical protein
MSTTLAKAVIVLLVVAACGGAASRANPTSQVGAGNQPAATGPAPTDAVTTPNGMSTEDVTTPRPVPTPGPTVPRVPTLVAPAVASRILVAGLGIDLPVVSGDLQPPPSYPFCDVAAYVTLFGQPYETGITYISAHAQNGMFAPLLAASKRNDGAEMLGMTVSAFTSDGRRFDYEISRVLRHRVDYSIVEELPLEQQTLILQTSEGVYGTVEKLQVVASFVSETTVDFEDANPEPKPRDCDPGTGVSPAPSSPAPASATP